MDITIIIPVYKPNQELLKNLLDSIKKQDYSGKIKIDLVDKGWGLAKQVNWGIKNAKTEIIVILQQDCFIPSKDWLKKLLAPFKDEKVLASSSKVELPYHFWKNFDIIAKLLTAKEEGVISSILDGKGDAYRKSVFIKVGLFDEETFTTAGEDCDMYLKLVKIGKIATPDIKVIHFHYYNWKKRLQKELQYANGFGTYVRIHKSGVGNEDMVVGFLKSLPLLGWPIFLIRLPYKKVGLLGILWIPLSLLANLIYTVGFWKGFLSGKQNVYPDTNR